ncbi:MAG: hypothetical protein ACXWQO_14985 [Bdellovibrionota bacterium]
MKFSAVLCFVFLAITGCEQQTPDGRIPADYLAEAKKMVGDYHGQMEGGQKGTLSVRLNGDKIIAKFSRSLLSCGGKIGNLQSVDVSGSSLNTATFALSNASCVEGNQLEFQVSSDQRTLSLRLQAYTTSETTCPTESEIDSCNEAWNKHDLECDNEASPALRDMCLSQNTRSRAGCSSCDTRSSTVYLDGSFVR